MYKYKIGDKVFVLPIKGNPYDYPYVYLPEMESKCAGKIAIIKDILPHFCNDKEKARKYYNGDSNCYILDIDKSYVLWHSSMFKPAYNLKFPFVDLKYFV